MESPEVARLPIRVVTGARWCVPALPLLLLACAHRPAARVSGAPVFYADTAGGARVCKVSRPHLKNGRQVSATMQMRNDGGWCAISVALNGKPYAAGLLIDRAAHGAVFIHPVGDATRIDYTPAPGYVGPDQFTVRLIPGSPELRVSVTVGG